MDTRPKRRSLTPLSGELRASAPEIARPARRRRFRLRRRRRRVPTTRLGVVVLGIGRYLAIVVALSAATVGVALLVVWLGDARPSRAAPLAFYIAGVIVAAGGVFSAADVGGSDWYWDQQEKESRVSHSVVFVALGLPLIGIGVLTDVLL